MQDYERKCKLKDIGKKPIKTKIWHGEMYFIQIGIKQAKEYINKAKYDVDVDIICCVCGNRDEKGKVFKISKYDPNQIHKLCLCNNCYKEIKSRRIKPKILYTPFESKR